MPDRAYSAIAQGQFAGVGPFGTHFTGQVDPGSHQGTVGEEEFLETVIGIPADQLQAFCAQSPCTDATEVNLVSHDRLHLRRSGRSVAFRLIRDTNAPVSPGATDSVFATSANVGWGRPRQ